MPETLPDCARITFTWLREGDDEIVETFHLYTGPGGLTFADAENIALDTATWIKTAANPWRDLKPSNITLDKIVVYDMSPGSLVNAEEAVGESGSAGSAAIAHQVAAVLTWTTPLRGASYRGRTYVGPFQSGHLTSAGLLTSTFLTTLADAAEALHGHFLGMSYPMMVASFTHQHLTDITGVRIDDSPDVQRRRARRASTSAVRTF